MKQTFALILAAILVIGLVAGLVSNYIATDNLQRAFRSTEQIDKIEMEISSHSGFKQIVIIDRNRLDSIDAALKEATEINAQVGGAFETWAHIKLYKKGHELNFFIQHSVYNGWMVEAENKTLSSPYLFQLVEFYAKQ